MHATNRTIRIFLLLFFSAAPFIWNFSGAFDGQIFREPYPGEYSGWYAYWPLRFVGLLPTAQSVLLVIGGSLRALERPNPMFCSSARGGVSAVALGVPLALHFGIGGALLGMLVSYALMGALTVVFVARFSRWEQV
jgi:O-antigen/teichoic acid export membrane protein